MSKLILHKVPLYFSVGNPLQDALDQALKDNVVNEVGNPKESLDQIEEGNIKLQTGNEIYIEFFLIAMICNVYTYCNFNI